MSTVLLQQLGALHGFLVEISGTAAAARCLGYFSAITVHCTGKACIQCS